MPTDNPKISLYVPQAIYDRFNQFKDEQGLSMSQAGIVILAEYFQVKEIIKETTKGTTIGGVTLARVEAIELKLMQLIDRTKDSKTELDSFVNKFKVLEEQLDYLMNQKENGSLPSELNNELKISDEQTDSFDKEEKSILPDELIIDNSDEQLSNLLSKLLVDYKLLAKRFGFTNPMSVSNHNKDRESQFALWSSQKDPDGIAWQKVQLGKKNIKYRPVENTISELLSKLQIWITENSEFRASAVTDEVGKQDDNPMLDDAADSLRENLLEF